MAYLSSGAAARAKQDAYAPAPEPVSSPSAFPMPDEFDSAPNVLPWAPQPQYDPNVDAAPNVLPWNPGLSEPGNIDLSNRPRVSNPDGSVSTVRSISVDMDGKTYLIPTVVGGRVVSNDEAIANFRNTGQHLGGFPDQQSADARAQQIHETQAAGLNRYSPEPSYDPYSASQGVDLSQGPYSGGDPGFMGSLRTAGQEAYNIADRSGFKGPGAIALGAFSGARPYEFQPGEVEQLAHNYAIGSVGGTHAPGAGAGEGIESVIARLRAKGLTPAEAMHDPEFMALQAKSGFMPDYNAKPADAVNASDVTVNLRRAREQDARLPEPAPANVSPQTILERARAKANEPRLPDTESQQQAIRAIIADEQGSTTVGNMLRPGVTNALGAGAGGVAGNAATPEDASPSERLWNIAIGAAGGLGAAALARKFPGERGSFDLGPRDNAPRPISDTPTSGRATTNTPVPKGREFVPPEDTRLTIAQHINNILSAPLSYLTGIDASAPGRQLFRSLVAHPGDVVPVLKAQFSAMRSEKNFAALQEAWRNDPIRPLMDQMGVELGDLGGNIGKREEYIQSTLPERTPLIGPLYRRTNAGYTAAINTRRILLSKLAVGQMPELVWKGTELLPEGLQELQRRGRLINAATGRGNMGEAFRESKVLGQPLFFAIRNRVGNMQVPLSAATSSSAWVRREAQKQMAGQIAFLGGLFATGKATGAWDVEADPRSSDWGQVRIGNRRFDFTAGMRPLVNVLAREGASIFNALPGTTDISNYKGINTPQQEGGLFTRKATEVLTNYMRGALAPTLGEAWTQLEGTDIIGQPIDQSLGGRAVHAAQGLLPALFLQQLAEELAYTVPKGYAQGGLGGAGAELGKSAASAVPYFSGVGGSYYQPRAPQIAAEGGYSGLKGEDQLAGVKAQAWTTIQNAQGAPDEVKSVGSYYDWRKHETARLFDQLSKSEGAPSSGETLAAVEKIIAKHPYTKAWENVRAKLENEWVVQNPQLTLDLYDDYKAGDADFQRSHADWNFNSKQREAARKAIEAKPKKQGTRIERDPTNARVSAVIDRYSDGSERRRPVQRDDRGRVTAILDEVSA